MAGLVDDSLQTDHFIKQLATAFGLLALLLAAIGLYGLMAYTVSRRTKDIGQKECIVLASSTAKQVSFERQEHDMSVMTYFLVDAIQNSTGPATLEQLFDRIKGPVDAYVEENFGGSRQTPVLGPKPIYSGLVRP